MLISRVQNRAQAASQGEVHKLSALFLVVAHNAFDFANAFDIPSFSGNQTRLANFQSLQRIKALTHTMIQHPIGNELG